MAERQAEGAESRIVQRPRCLLLTPCPSLETTGGGQRVISTLEHSDERLHGSYKGPWQATYARFAPSAPGRLLNHFCRRQAARELSKNARRQRTAGAFQGLPSRSLWCHFDIWLNTLHRPPHNFSTLTCVKKKDGGWCGSDETIFQRYDMWGSAQDLPPASSCRAHSRLTRIPIQTAPDAGAQCMTEPDSFAVWQPYTCAHGRGGLWANGCERDGVSVYRVSPCL